MKSILITIFIIGLLFFVQRVHAQTPPPPPSDPQSTPVDGGLALLAAAGGGYAIKKLRDRQC